MMHTHDFIMSVLMSLTKQAKTLTKLQIKLITGLIQQTRYPVRNQAIFLLSVRAGLRAKEIAGLTWDMVTEADGQLSASIHLRDVASKGRSGRIIPLNKELRGVLQALKEHQDSSPFVITTERSERTSAAAIVSLFAGWYRAAGLKGCSSHSGRRTFITNAARKISTSYAQKSVTA